MPVGTIDELIGPDPLVSISKGLKEKMGKEIASFTDTAMLKDLIKMGGITDTLVSVVAEMPDGPVKAELTQMMVDKVTEPSLIEKMKAASEKMGGGHGLKINKIGIGDKIIQGPKNDTPAGKEVPIGSGTVKLGAGTLFMSGLKLGDVKDLKLDVQPWVPQKTYQMKGMPVEKLVALGMGPGVLEHFNTSFGKDKWSVMINKTDVGWVYDLASGDDHVAIALMVHAGDGLIGAYHDSTPMIHTKPPPLDETEWLDAGLKLYSKLMQKKVIAFNHPNQGTSEIDTDNVIPFTEKFFSPMFMANMKVVLGTDKWTLAKIECPFDDGHEYVLKAHGLKEKVYLTENQQEVQNIKHTVSLMATKIMDQLKGMAAQPTELEESMVVAINKGGALAEAQPQPMVVPKVAPIAKNETQALIDELGTLNDKVVELEMKETMKRIEEIRKTLLQSIAPEQNGQDVVMEGVDYNAHFKANADQYTLMDKQGLMQKIGEPVFLELAKFGVTDLKKVLSENEMKKYGNVEPTGARILKTIKKQK